MIAFVRSLFKNIRREAKSYEEEYRKRFLFSFYIRGTIVVGFFFTFSHTTYILPSLFDAALFVMLGRQGRKQRERKTKARCAPSVQKPRGASSRVVMSSLHPFAVFHPFAPVCVATASITRRYLRPRWESRGAFRGFHANQFYIIIRECRHIHDVLSQIPKLHTFEAIKDEKALSLR